MSRYPPEFGLFPFKAFRVNPPFLQGSLPASVKDPWAQRDAWRHSEFFSQSNRTKRLFPGLGLALVAFAGYVAYDQWYTSSGPGKEEREYWDNWMHERQHRLALEEGHKQEHGH